MSFLTAVPDAIATAAGDLANIGTTLGNAHATAVAPTTNVLAAGADEVSAAVAPLFSGRAQAYQGLAAQAASFHDQFVQLINGGGAAYATAESQNVAQAASNAINGPAAFSVVSTAPPAATRPCPSS